MGQKLSGVPIKSHQTLGPGRIIQQKFDVGLTWGAKRLERPLMVPADSSLGIGTSARTLVTAPSATLFQCGGLASFNSAGADLRLLHLVPLLTMSGTCPDCDGTYFLHLPSFCNCTQ